MPDGTKEHSASGHTTQCKATASFMSLQNHAPPTSPSRWSFAWDDPVNRAVAARPVPTISLLLTGLQHPQLLQYVCWEFMAYSALEHRWHCTGVHQDITGTHNAFYVLHGKSAIPYMRQHASRGPVTTTRQASINVQRGLVMHMVSTCKL